MPSRVRSCFLIDHTYAAPSRSQYAFIHTMSRPGFIAELEARPLPLLAPPKLTDSSNPPYSPSARSAIADLKCHPLLESALHLMNDDLFSAHFLLRKMQEDEWGKWLHGILHLMGMPLLIMLNESKGDRNGWESGKAKGLKGRSESGTELSLRYQRRTRKRTSDKN
jgi:hypothetical protein